MRRLRVGAVRDLNAKPLYHGLDALGEIDLLMDVPSRLAERLRRGDLDVALIPSIEYLRGAHLGYRIVPGFAIAARGPVWSVRLFCRRPLSRIHSLALDDASRTSQALTRILLAKRHGVRPERIETLPIGVPMQECLADAILLIGDKAIGVDERPFVRVIDLAQDWKEWTGLPFVFAVWTARAGVELGNLPELLESCRASALANPEALVAAHGVGLGLDHDQCLEYLTSVLSYDLDPPAIEGMRRFARLAAELDLAPQGVDLVFHHPSDLVGHPRG